MVVGYPPDASSGSAWGQRHSSAHRGRGHTTLGVTLGAAPAASANDQGPGLPGPAGAASGNRTPDNLITSLARCAA